MMADGQDGFLTKARRFLLGRPLDPSNQASHHSITLVAFFAWVGLGSDGLSSSAYGPEEAFLALGNHPHLAILIALASALTVLVISASYSQIIELFPSGGGGYVVASKLLSPHAGMLSGCALVIDYVLTIAISMASATDAVFSFLPRDWQPWKLEAALAATALLALLNLRGAKESVMPMVPIFLVFLATHGFAILYAFGTHLLDVGDVARETVTEIGRTHGELGLWGMLFLLLKAFSMGAGTYTGIEAVSNGLGILREPKVRTGKRTMLYMAISLSVTVFGLTMAYLLFKVGHEPGKTLNATLFGTLTEGWPGFSGTAFVQVSLVSEALLLFAAAQAGFLDGPRVMANMALDRWFPSRFSHLSERLVSQNGILIMGAAALVTLYLTGGSVKYLVVLYSITVFVTFVLSQAGMVRHWWSNRSRLPHWRRKLSVNGLGLAVCSFILVAIVILKFRQGGWITLLVTGALAGVALLIRRHYAYVESNLRRLDSLVAATRSEGGKGIPPPPFDPKAKTAVLLVDGFNGLGLHSVLAIVRMFGSTFRNFIFVQVGVIDAGTFKGAEEVGRLKAHVEEELAGYVEYMSRNGCHAEAFSTLSHDAVEGCAELAAEIQGKYPQAVFFMGQLVFPQETLLSPLFHNNTVFAVQRRLYHRGLPFIILPIRIQLGKGGK
jgi:amino acid transporter